MKRITLIACGILFAAAVVIIPISISASSDALPLEKQKIENEAKEFKTNAKKITKEEAAKLKPVHNNNAFQKGIIEDTEVPAGIHHLLVQNHWQGDYDGNLGLIYAGNYVDDPDQGLLFVETRTLEQVTLGITEIKTPVKTGSLRIVKIEGDKLEITSTQGENYEFNLKTKALTTK